GGCFAELGHRVIVRDVVPERIAELQAGRLPFHEPDLSEVLARNRERIRYTLDAGDLAEADVLFVCVQTPPTYSGDADLSFARTARRWRHSTAGSSRRWCGRTSRRPR